MGGRFHLEWPSTILGIIAICVTIPIYIFYWHGPWFRSNSKFASILASDREETKSQATSRANSVANSWANSVVSARVNPRANPRPNLFGMIREILLTCIRGRIPIPYRETPRILIRGPILMRCIDQILQWRSRGSRKRKIKGWGWEEA
jgi:hypothetical protein